METLSQEMLAELAQHYQALIRAVPLQRIETEDGYDAAVTVMNNLLDAGAANENHPLAGLVVILGELIAHYDEHHYQLPEVTGVDALRLLMQQNHLTQSDLPEIGTQGVISEILRGKRELNLRHIRALAERFHVPPVVFIQNSYA